MSFVPRETQFCEETASHGVDWEECDCLSCGSESWAALVEAPDQAPGSAGLWFMVVKCQECGLCFTNPRPRASAIDGFYGRDYPPHLPSVEPPHRPRWWQVFRVLGKPSGDRLRKMLPWHGDGRLLDFGCGGGSFLLRMREQGWLVTGVDTSESTALSLRGQFGLHVLTGSLPHPDLDDASYDVVTMWQSLEHTHEPLEILRSAFRVLVPGGKLIVAVPNIDSLAFRWFGSAWNGLDLPRHLVHFSPATLKSMLQRAGFRVGRVRMIRRSGWLRTSARQASRHFAGKNRWFSWLQGKSASNLASWYAFLTRQADCMMITAVKR